MSSLEVVKVLKDLKQKSEICHSRAEAELN